MTSKSLSDNDKPVGVIGAGNFGSVVANLLARQKKVLLYARDEKVIRQIEETRLNRGHTIHPNVFPTNDLPSLAGQCDIIFPIIPSEHFRGMIQQLSPYLHPYHILIHGTKGFDVTLPEGQTIDTIPTLDRRHGKNHQRSYPGRKCRGTCWMPCRT
jgi:glycerol-3-phosphate dehydrogenase (NAD(P)+)